MTKIEYAEYQAEVAEFTANVQFISQVDCEAEPFFSWHSCDVCHSVLGGNREEMQGISKATDERIEFTACEDCVYYLEYGQLDDMQMLEIEAAAFA